MGKRERNRGVVFSASGWQKLLTKKQIWSDNYREGRKCTLEDLSEITNLSYNTVLKIQERRQGVDKRSLVKFALSFDFELLPCDYISANSLPNPPEVNSPAKVSWDQKIELTNFSGRKAELAQLKQWLLKDSCRLISIQGIAGIGKTALCAKLVELVQPQFDQIVWRSLQHKSSLKELIIDLIQVFSGQSRLKNSGDLSTKSCMQQLVYYLRSRKCLVILDGLDAIMTDGQLCGSYDLEYQEYAHFIKYLGESIHQSCLILTTREKPRELKLLSGNLQPVYSLSLAALSQPAAKKILSTFNLNGSEAAQERLINQLGGHPFAIKLVAQSIHDTCDRQISQFLQQEIVMLELQYFWQQQLTRLSRSERKILFAVASCDHPPCFASLRAIIPDSIFSAQIIESLESLLGRSLIVKKSGNFAVCPQLLINVEQSKAKRTDKSLLSLLR